MFKAVYKFLLIVILFLACLLPLATVKAQAFTLTINADNSQCASVYVNDLTSATTQTFSSFPAYFAVDFGDNVELTVTPNSGYLFSYADGGYASFLSNPFTGTWVGGGTVDIFFTALPAPTPTPPPGPTPTPAPSPTGYQYIFNGLLDEDNNFNFLGNATVTAYYSNGSYGIGGRTVESFTLNGTYVYNPPTKPLYFSYDLTSYYSVNMTRQYWLGINETSATLYVYAAPSGLTPITFNVRALGGVSFPNSFLIVTSIYSGNIIEKIPIDSLGNVVMNLKSYSLYSFSIQASTSYSFGNVATTSTQITLTISPLSFPPEVLQQYKYLRLWASRSGTEIKVNYQDTNNHTMSVAYHIDFANGTIAYSNIEYTNQFSDIWANADNATTYYLTAVVSQSVFGTTTFNQVLAGSAGAVLPIDLSFFGSFGGADPTQLVGAIIVLVVFGCFSALNAWIGVFSGVATAAIMMWIGWLNIPEAAIVAAFALVILLAITYWKRRGG